MLDLKNEFFHVDIAESSRKFSSFVVPDGQFEFKKVPFGLCNSPTVFQRFINTVFQTLIREGAMMVYMDDIVIPSVTEKENVAKLKRVLKIAAENGMIIKWEKSHFLRWKIEYLGHIIEGGSVKPSEEKTRAVLDFPTPTTIKVLRSFLGLTAGFSENSSKIILLLQSR